MAQPIQPFLSLPFGDAKTKLGQVVHAAEAVAEFVNNEGAWLIPDPYKTALADIVKILNGADHLLNKT